MTIKNLCSSCNKNCSMDLKTEFALNRDLTYIYLRNDRKLINSCNHFTLNGTGKASSPSPINDPHKTHDIPKLNLGTGLNLVNFVNI